MLFLWAAPFNLFHTVLKNIVTLPASLLTLDYFLFAAAFIFHAMEIEPKQFHAVNVKEEDTVTSSTDNRWETNVRKFGRKLSLKLGSTFYSSRVKWRSQEYTRVILSLYGGGGLPTLKHFYVTSVTWWAWVPLFPSKFYVIESKCLYNLPGTYISAAV